MNNSQFRKLVLDTPARQSSSTDSKPGLGATPRRDGTSALGSRIRSSIPMTPRSVGGIDFARQLAEQRLQPSKATKKFRSSAAPKGALLPSGYVDRAKTREDSQEDEKAERVKALEEMMKLQQIDEATFVKLRDEILGGDVSSTHLVKGLDWKLLERVKRGEDVLGGEKEEDEEPVDEADVDEAFDDLESLEVEAVKREKTEKKGEMAPPSLIPGKKRNRNQILAELKAARKAAQEAQGPSLGAKFKKVGDKRLEPRYERDSKGREVLITVDEDGNEKRKIRKVQPQPEEEKGHGLMMPDKDAKPLGMEVPEILKPAQEEEEDLDIFDDVGDDYDPLAGLDDDDDADSDADGGKVSKPAKEDTVATPGSMGPPPKPTAPRNYFGDAQSRDEETKPNAVTDPTILAALKKASSLNPIAREDKSAEEAAKEAKRKKMLQQDDRDAQDMDMGFGSSRFEDEEDLSEAKVKLSQWKGNGHEDDDEGEEKKGSKEKRKRGPKKRKGDANNAADVLAVMERRKKES